MGFAPYSASGAAGPVHAGCPRPPPSALGVSHALDGLLPATPVRACFIPVTLLGFRLQGFGPPGEPYPSRGRMLSCRSDLPPKPRSEGRRTRLQSFFPPGEFAPRRAETRHGRCPPGVVPSKALPTSGVERSRMVELHSRAAQPATPTIPPGTSPCGCASGCCPPETLASPPCGGAGLPGVCHLVPSEPLRTRPSVGDRFSRTT